MEGNLNTCVWCTTWRELAGGEGGETKSFLYAMSSYVMTSFTIAEKSENLRFPVLLQKVTSCYLGRIRMV